MKTYIMQYRTSSSHRWITIGNVQARSPAGAIAQVARSLSDIKDGSLEISACAAF